MPIYAIEGIVPVVAPGAFVHPDAILIGDVQIGAGCYIGPAASLRGDFGRIIVGAGSNVQDGCVLHAYPGKDLELHADSHVGHGAVLHGCTIHSQVLVGMNAVIMDGAVVGRNSLVAAGTVVQAATEVPEAHLIAGVPGRVLKALDDDTLAWKSNGVRTYQELAVRSLASLERVEPLSEPEPARRRIQASGSARASLPPHERRARRERGE